MAKEKMKTKEREFEIGLDRGLPTAKLRIVKTRAKPSKKTRAKPKVKQYYCRHCRKYHLFNSAVGRLHRNPSYWRKKAKAKKRK